jgi:hypothetical protein
VICWCNPHTSNKPPIENSELVAKTIDNVKGLLERIAAVTPSSTAKDQVR